MKVGKVSELQVMGREAGKKDRGWGWKRAETGLEHIVKGCVDGMSGLGFFLTVKNSQMFTWTNSLDFL